RDPRLASTHATLTSSRSSPRLLPRSLVIVPPPMESFDRLIDSLALLRGRKRLALRVPACRLEDLRLLRAGQVPREGDLVPLREFKVDDREVSLFLRGRFSLGPVFLQCIEYLLSLPLSLWLGQQRFELLDYVRLTRKQSIVFFTLVPSLGEQLQKPI